MVRQTTTRNSLGQRAPAARPCRRARQKPVAARCAAHSPRAAPDSSPASSGSNSTESARGPSSRWIRGWSGSPGIAHQQLVLAELAPVLVLGELLAGDQHDVLAARALEVEVKPRLRVGVQVHRPQPPEQLVDPEAVRVQAPPVAEQEVECGEAARVAGSLDRPAQGRDHVAGVEVGHQQVEEALRVGVPDGRAVRQRLQLGGLQDRAVVAVGVRAARERMRVLQGQPPDRRATHVHHDQPRPSAGEIVERLVRMRRLREAVHLLAVLGVVDAAPAGVVRLGLAQDGVVGAQQLEGDVDRVAGGCGEEPAHVLDCMSDACPVTERRACPPCRARDGPGRCRPSRTGPG